MGRRGQAPDLAKREAYARLIGEGMSSLAACREVGIIPRTGKRWRNGRKVLSAGRYLEYGPVVDPAVVRPLRVYSSRFLSCEERVVLADHLAAGLKQARIAELMGRSAATISREVRRGRDDTGRYRPHAAHERALERRRVERPAKLARDEELRDWVVGKLKARWSPEQISRQMRRDFPDEPDRWVCAETIYQTLYRPERGGLPRELPGTVLRYRRRRRRSQRHAQRRRGTLVGMVPIAQRPPEADGREQAGHLEGDLIQGRGNTSAIITLVDRSTRHTLLGHLPGGKHDAITVRDALVSMLSPLPAHMGRTVTWDQGKEMARHAELAVALPGTNVYFCEPHSPWQRPTNENTNGLLRDYFPKGTDLSVHSAQDVAAVQHEINARPRAVLEWDSPAERHAAALATLDPSTSRCDVG